VAVRIRMKKMGRKHRPFYRICAIDGKAPRDGRVLEELGTYDPMVPDVDARAVLNSERINYWIGVGAQPSDKVKIFIKKYGEGGTHLDKQRVALDRLAQSRKRPEPVASVAAAVGDKESAEEQAVESSVAVEEKSEE